MTLLRFKDELAPDLARLLEELELLLRIPLAWESGALLTAAAALERAAERLAEVDLRLQERLEELRRQRTYLVRKADALRIAGRAALPAEDGHGV